MHNLKTRLERGKDITIPMDRTNDQMGVRKTERTAQRTHNGQNRDRKLVRCGIPWMATALLTLVSLSNVATVAAADMEYCSNVNTADGSAGEFFTKPCFIQLIKSTVTDIYQSNGLCFDTCKATHAFAIVQGKSCWCSDYAPASDTSGCDSPCPGYPDESCGNPSKKLYGYMALGNPVKGTQGSADDTVSQMPSVEPTTVTTEREVTTRKDGPTTTVIIVRLPSLGILNPHRP